MKRLFVALVASLFALPVIAACGGNNGVTGGSNAPHGARCLTDYDCMGGYECSKNKDDFFGECVPKGTAVTSGAGSSGGSSGGSATKPAPKSSSDGASNTTGTTSAPPKSAATSHGNTPEPLPPPKPPKDNHAPAPSGGSDFTP